MIKRLLILLCATAFSVAVWAHGDDGESAHSQHAHAAPSAALKVNSVVPTLAAQSERFELVARLYPDELGIYIDDWASNAPVLNASLEVEVDGRKAGATFHADHGDYALKDAAVLQALRAPGDHAVAFVLQAGAGSDRLAGTLHVANAEGAAVEGEHPVQTLHIAIAATVVLVAVLGIYLRKRRGKGELQ